MLAALAGSQELANLKRQYQLAFIEKCRSALAPFTGPEAIGPATGRCTGLPTPLSHAAAMAEITPEQAQAELFETIVAMVGRSK